MLEAVKEVEKMKAEEEKLANDGQMVVRSFNEDAHDDFYISQAIPFKSRATREVTIAEKNLALEKLRNAHKPGGLLDFSVRKMDINDVEPTSTLEQSGLMIKNMEERRR